METADKANTSHIIIDHVDQQTLESCSFDSPCALTPKDRIQMAAIAAAGIGIMSLAMYAFYWLAMKFL